ncbi:hypothetical protein N9I30_01210, partial [Flavobacteriales bacterium]|nr:hypothetical protein [Flavobacteriales bacterium]
KFKIMDLYSIKGDRLNSVELKSFKKERDIQDIVEKNTETLFDVDFVSSEFKIGEFRIYTTILSVNSQNEISKMKYTL